MIQFCPKCGNTNIVKSGYAIISGGKKQRFVCKSCGHVFSDKKLKSIVEIPEEDLTIEQEIK